MSEYGQAPDYSGILKDLAKTQSERQRLIRQYFEPTSAEREEGRKVPTPAHNALALLAKKQFVRVIITTNFDRLIEHALSEADVEHTVLSSTDQVKGAMPLNHTGCCVLKVHGDYQDTRIKNTEAELGEYSNEVNKLLDQIFNEFGLVVCGWSAQWDFALRAAIDRASSRRFSTYWASHGVPGDAAKGLIQRRDALEIPNTDANSFFGTLCDQVLSLDEFTRPHPLDTEVAVASLKRFAVESRYRVKLADLIGGAVRQVIEITASEDLAVLPNSPADAEEYVRRVKTYDAACSQLSALGVVGGRWVEQEHFMVWRHGLEHVGRIRYTSGDSHLLDLQRYPASLLFYALGLGAVRGERLAFLKHLFQLQLPNPRSGLRDGEPDELQAIDTLPAGQLLYPDGQLPMQCLPGMTRMGAPLSRWISQSLRPHALRIIPDSGHYELEFDFLELMMALCLMSLHSYLLEGVFYYRANNTQKIIKRIRDSIRDRGEGSPFVSCGIFGLTVAECEGVLSSVEQQISMGRSRLRSGLAQ